MGGPSYSVDFVAPNIEPRDQEYSSGEAKAMVGLWGRGERGMSYERAGEGSDDFFYKTMLGKHVQHMLREKRVGNQIREGEDQKHCVNFQTFSFLS